MQWIAHGTCDVGGEHAANWRNSSEYPCTPWGEVVPRSLPQRPIPLSPRGTCLMKTTTIPAGTAARILAIDLGKYKSVACVYDPAGNPHPIRAHFVVESGPTRTGEHYRGSPRLNALTSSLRINPAWLQFLRMARPALGDLDQVLRQVEELLAVGEHVHQPVRQERLLPDGSLLDFCGGYRHPVRTRRVDQRECCLLLLGEQSGDGPSVGHGHDD